jgi:hypothetical protein
VHMCLVCPEEAEEGIGDWIHVRVGWLFSERCRWCRPSWD